MAAYLRLPRKKGDWATRSQEYGNGLVVDFAEDDRPIGIEITAPSAVSLQVINDLLRELGQSEVTEDDLAPLTGRALAG